jgi:putative flippase GtrA
MLAATTSFLVGAIVAYYLSVKLAFKQHRLEDRRAEFLSFVAIGAAGLAVNSAVIFVMVRQFGLNFLTAKFIAAGFTFMCNFFARRQILFIQNSTI